MNRTMTVRDVRQRWPEAERLLREQGEVVITRDAVPVARLVPIAGQALEPRERLDLGELRRWRDRFWARQPAQPSTDLELADDRDDDP